MERKFVLFGLIWAFLGMSLAIFMSISGNHSQMTTHTHIMLLGFVVSMIYAMLHKLWLASPSGTLVVVQAVFHTVGASLMFIGLFLMFAQFVDHEQIEPVLAIGSLLVITALLLMIIMFVRSKASADKAAL